MTTSLTRYHELLDRDDAPRAGATSRHRIHWAAELMASGQWGALDSEAKGAIRDGLAKRCSVSPSTVQMDLRCASVLLDMLVGDRERLIAIHQLRIDNISQTAEEPRDRLAASKVMLQSLGALTPKRTEEDVSQLSDKQLRHRMLQDLRHPSKELQELMREAFATPGARLRKLLEEWLSATTTTTTGEETL